MVCAHSFFCLLIPTVALSIGFLVSFTSVRPSDWVLSNGDQRRYRSMPRIMCHYPSALPHSTSLSFFRVFDGGNTWEASSLGKEAAKDTQINGNPVTGTDKRMALFGRGRSANWLVLWNRSKTLGLIVPHKIEHNALNESTFESAKHIDKGNSSSDLTNKSEANRKRQVSSANSHRLAYLSS